MTVFRKGKNLLPTIKAVRGASYRVAPSFGKHDVLQKGSIKQDRLPPEQIGACGSVTVRKTFVNFSSWFSQ
jgi:hypothetical protein